MISVVILTHNDEGLLTRALESVAWCDEVIVVDDFSRDDTADIARKEGALVFQRSVGDDFAKQRNYGLSKAKGEWVLYVDSDEVVTNELAKEIQKEVHSEQFTGYRIKRNDWMWGGWLKHGETGRVKLLRLAKKDAGIWTRPVHETWNVKGEVGELAHPLLHYPHPNVAQFIKVINRYSTLNARYLKSQGINASWWHIIVYPKAKFFLDYIWYLGFLDGTAGAVMAITMSFHSFLTRAKLFTLRDTNLRMHTNDTNEL